MKSERTEEELVAQLLTASGRGDVRAFRSLYQRTSPRLYGLLMRMLRRPDLAKDALQECYVRIWQKADHYVPEKGDPMSWLFTVARYRAIDLARTRSYQIEPGDNDEETLLQIVDSAQSPEDRAIEREGLQRLNHCLRGLSDEQRKSLLLAYYEGYSHQELAREMKAPLGTVKAWVRRGLQRLRACLDA